MSMPYNVTAFNTARAEESWIEYPFIEQGVPTAKVYCMNCKVNVSAYTAVTIGTAMTTAAAAGVIVLPFTANANAFFVGDFGHSYSDGGIVEFTRKFATVPGTWTEVVGSEIKEFPALVDNSNVKQRPPTAEQSPVRVTHTYQVGQTFTFSAIFQVTINGHVVPFVRGEDTSPTFDEYTASIVAKDWLLIRNTPLRYMGNIFEVKKFAIQAR
jgi:hypothetical protein